MPDFETKFLGIIIVSAWFIRSVLCTLSLLALWQFKEYRYDRLRVHLSTTQGKSLIFNYFNLLKWLLLFSFPLIYFSGKYRFSFPILVAFVFILEVLDFIKQKIFQEFKRPKLTLKAKILLLGPFFLQIFLLLLAYSVKNYFRLSPLNFLAVATLLLDRTLALSIFLFILILALPTSLSKKRIIKKAKLKMKKRSDLRVIGITGSYGKTSTKEFLSTVLSAKFKVLKTVGSENTDIGVAQTILSRLKDDDEVFIVEMGAYKPGEIKAITEIVHPQIGIITAIGEAHLGIFGSLENILKTKMELVEALPEKGLAILNGDSEALREAASRLKVRKLFFGSKQKFEIFSEEILVAKRKLRFSVVKDDLKAEFEVPLLGRQNIANLLAVTLVALKLGFSLMEVAKAVRKITPPKKTMEPIKGGHGSIFIDDTYNTNPKGVEAALRFLGETDWHKKFLVLHPLIELGEKAGPVHIKLATLMGNLCDEVYLTNPNYKKHLRIGFEQSKKRAEFFWLKNRKQISETIHKKLEKHDVVLFEGKEAEKVLTYLKKLR